MSSTEQAVTVRCQEGAGEAKKNAEKNGAVTERGKRNGAERSGAKSNGYFFLHFRVFLQNLNL